MVDHIVSSQILSFTLALIAIFAALAVLFRSLGLALLSLPANLLPVFVTLGAMGLLGVRLDVATVTIAAIVLGIVVDDTVLFLYFLRHEQERRASMADAIRAAVDGAGQSILMTTLALGLGFLVYGLAEVKSIVWFGLLVSLAMATALLADLKSSAHEPPLPWAWAGQPLRIRTDAARARPETLRNSFVLVRPRIVAENPVSSISAPGNRTASSSYSAEVQPRLVLRQNMPADRGSSSRSGKAKSRACSFPPR